MTKQKSQPMKAKEIQDLISFISDTGLEEVNIETDQIKLEIKRSSGAVTAVASSIPPAPIAVSPPQIQAAPVTSPVPVTPPTEAPSTASDNLLTIKSPMIGTFYRSGNPDSPPLVSVGDTVDTNTTVCIVEAMKLFNEIDASVSGKIVEVLVENAQPVEFDQPLFLVDPS